MSLSEERLDEIRDRAAWTCRERGADIDALLAHVDHLTAKHERARADWKTTIKFRTTQRNEERAENARLREGIADARMYCSRSTFCVTIPPTEGETDEPA